MPSVQSVQVSAPISAFASGYKNDAFLAEKLLPVVFVDGRKGTYYSRSRVDVASIYDDLIGPNSESATVDYATTSSTFEVKDRGLKAYVPMELINNADDPLKPREGYAGNVMQRLLLAQEKRVSDLVLTSGNYAASNTGAATAIWTNHSLSSPVKDLQTAMAAVAPGDAGKTKLVLTLGLEAFQALSRHPEFLGLRGGGGTESGVATPDEIAGMLKIDEILVSDLQRNTAARGATASYTRMWDTTKAALLRVPKSTPSFEENLGLFACIFRHKNANNMPFGAVEWMEPDRGPGDGTLAIKITHSSVESLIQNDMGYLLTSVT